MLRRVRSLELGARLVTDGAGDGVAFDKIDRIPNTPDVHRLIRLADERGVRDAVATGWFETYFPEGRDISDRKRSSTRRAVPDSTATQRIEIPNEP